MNRRIQYKVEVDYTELPHTNTLDGVSADVEVLRFRREGNSHRGISRLTKLHTLVAFCVNQECLEEIAELPNLTTLHIPETTASSADCLSKCRRLRHLIIKGGTKFKSLAWMASLPPLESLLLEHFKLISDISAIECLPSLTAFGFEGSMWATQRIENLRPAARLPNLEALFLTNLRAQAEGLSPLHKAEGLRYLEVAAYFPDEDFLALRQALPKLECGWFESIDKYGSTKAAIKARVRQIRLK